MISNSMKAMTLVAVLAVMLAGVAVMSDGDESEGATTLLYTVQLGDSVYAYIFDNGNTTVSGSGAMNDFTGSTALLNAYSDYIVNVTIGSGVTSIGNYAFYNCTSLESISIGSGVTSIGNYAFYNCTSLESISIGSGVTSIGSYAFYYCSSLTSVTIPASVTSIGSYAFRYCRGLTTLSFEGTQPSIGTGAFYLGSTAGKATCIVASPNNWAEAVLDNYTNSMTTLTYVDSTSSATLLYTVQLGDNVYAYIYDDGNTTVSGSGAMYDFTTTTKPLSDYAEYIESVTIGSGVTSIGDYVFSNCTSLTSVTIPSSVTSIGKWAFYHCTSLTSVTIPSSVTSIGADAFYGCLALTSVTIGSGVTSIGSYAFSTTGLTSVTIPASVTSIGSYAFSWNYYLNTITFEGSQPSIGSYAFRLGYSTLVVYSIVYSPDNWAEGVLEDYSNEYTVFTYLNSTETTTYTFTLYFDANGGSGAPSALTYTGTESSHTFTIPSTEPTWSGYTFLGWSSSYYTAGDTVTLTASGTTSVSRTLYAQWSGTTTYTFTLVYDANGGSGAPSTQTYTGTTTNPNGTIIWRPTISSTEPTRDGYEFLGWSTSSTATTASYQPGDTISLSSSGTTNTTITQTLYAVWTENEIVFVTSVSIAETVIVATGDSITLTATTSPSDATDRGVTWSILAGAQHASISSTATTSTGGTCTLTLTGVGTVTVCATANDNSGVYSTASIAIQNIFTLVYDANGGSGAPDTETYTYALTAHTFTISSTEPTRDGYTFLGWATSSTATTASYQPGDSISVSTSGVTNVSQTLYAVWGEISTYTFTLVYDANGGSGAPSTQTYTGTETSHTFTIPSTEPTREGYEFLGWATTSTTLNATYQSGDSITVMITSSETTSVTQTLYAIWTTNVFTLAYNANGGSGAPETETYTGTGTTYTFTISSTSPTRSGYTFLGWATSSTATIASYYPEGTITLALDDTVTSVTQTLYAIWRGDTGGGSSGDSDGSHVFGVIDTEVFMNTYSAVITDASLDLDDYFSDYENLRVNFYSFALYGSSMTINGIEIPVTGGTVTFEDTTYTLQNIYVTYEDGYVYLTFASESGSLTRSTVIGLGEEVDRVLTFDGSWYFTMGIWSGATAVQDGIELGWEWSFDGMQAILAFVGVAILGIILASRYSRMSWLDWLIVVIGALVAFTIAGLI